MDGLLRDMAKKSSGNLSGKEATAPKGRKKTESLQAARIKGLKKIEPFRNPVRKPRRALFKRYRPQDQPASAVCIGHLLLNLMHFRLVEPATQRRFLFGRRPGTFTRFQAPQTIQVHLAFARFQIFNALMHLLRT